LLLGQNEPKPKTHSCDHPSTLLSALRPQRMTCCAYSSLPLPLEPFTSNRIF
jgi:hypothetical protein